jgi:hypothetical protein
MKIPKLGLRLSRTLIAFILCAIVMVMVGAWIWHPVATGYAQTSAFGALDTDNTWTHPNRFNGELGVTLPGNYAGWYHPNAWYFGGITDSMIRAMQGYRGSGFIGTTTDGLTIGHLVPAKGTSTGQVNGIGVYINTLASDNGGGVGPNPVGYYSRVTTGVAGATIWGANFNISDDYGGTSYRTTEFGQENDCNVSNAATAGACALFGAVFTAQPSNMGVIHVAQPGGGLGYRWNYGLYMDDGAVTGTGIYAGSTGTSANSPSNQVTFGSYNSLAAKNVASLFLDSLNAFEMNASVSSTIDYGSPLAIPSSGTAKRFAGFGWNAGGKQEMDLWTGGIDTTGSNPAVNFYQNTASGYGFLGSILRNGGTSFNSYYVGTNQVISANIEGTFNSVAGTGTATFTAGAAAGSGFTAPTCSTGHLCDSVSGTVSFTMGTGTTPGVLLTVNLPFTRGHQPNCTGQVYLVSPPYTALPVRLLYTTSTIVFNVGAAPSALTAYELVYSACGGN